MTEKYPWQQQQDKRREERRPQKKPRQPIKKNNVKLKKKSKKLGRNERIYSVLRKDYLLDHPVCECGQPRCTGEATQIHHKKGRGRWLNFVEFFLAVCFSCHEWIENNPKEAKALGYSLPRIEKKIKQ